VNGHDMLCLLAIAVLTPFALCLAVLLVGVVLEVGTFVCMLPVRIAYALYRLASYVGSRLVKLLERSSAR
jgi:hypothetical protein